MSIVKEAKRLLQRIELSEEDLEMSCKWCEATTDLELDLDERDSQWCHKGHNKCSDYCEDYIDAQGFSYEENINRWDI